MKILIYFNFSEEQIQTFQRIASEHGDHEVLHATNDDEAIRMALEAKVLIGLFPPAVCAVAPKLRWIQSHSAGMDNFLFPEIIERDVTVTNMAGLYASQGGEHAWALLLSLARGIPHTMGTDGRRAWKMPAVELTGSTLGIIALGGFGMEILKRAQGYDMTVLAVDLVRQDKPDGVAELKPPTSENLHDLLRRSDAVMIACPKTPETYHLIGEAELASMKKTAYLVNVTRGGIIDEVALVAALKNGEIAGAGLDVTEVEPTPPDSPLWDAPNLIITPHRAGASQHRPRKTFEFFCENLRRYLSGEELRNIVDKKRGF
ncbi:MAG: D-2-hydroxyacid dehydrogenase [Candidatus Poribacteria bacterium]|nr:D-2-hydroxyacid dehydrogenase [Candidatus Poribacteria bacterium]